MTIRELVDLFVSWCGEHRKPATVRFYRARLRCFVERFADRVPQSLTALEINAYLAAANRYPAGHARHGELMAPDTRRGNAIAVERLQAWLLEQGVITEAWVKRLEKPGGRRRERIAAPEETERIMAAAAPEFRLIYRALRQTGARPGELCGALIEQIDWEAGVLVIRDHKTAGKTGRPRRIGLGAKFRALLAEAIGDRTAGPIFRTASRKPWTPQHVSATFRGLREKLGLGKDLVLYSARHEHATIMLEQTHDIYAVKESLGHNDIKTTQRYLHPNDESLRQNQDLVD